MVKSEYKYISGKELISFLDKKYGIQILSQRGSHIKVKINNIKSIIPNHKTLAYGTFSGILKQLEIEEGEFLKYINSNGKTD